MNIIFVSNSMAKAKTLSLWQALLLLVALLVIPPLLLLTFILPQAGGNQQGDKAVALLTKPLLFIRDNPQEHLNALAMQLGQIQARVVRLDALSERLAKLAGIKDKDFNLDKPAGQGGPMVHEYNLSEKDIQEQIELLTRQLGERSERLAFLESLLLQQSLNKSAMPSGRPVNVAYNSSSFGWRVDPFTGQMAFHEGLDFMAEVGSPIYAAAGGIVVSAESTPDYGKLIKVDHGSGVETRYAHASALLVKAGDRVEKGQLIARVGNSGRSTGAHLHFEVRVNGVALDPRRYLLNNQG
jgi:murein DD-endopeptidase MepM/ murein hydrolase activator NlpD